MNISLIQIRNILGIKELDITPGKVTEIKGRNGTGKSSVLGAIRAALGVSEFSPAQLIHQGEEQGEIVLVLDDGTTVKRRITANGTDVKVTDAQGMKFAKPQTILQSLFAVTQFNPLALLQADKKSRDERTRTVLECLPLSLDKDTILELTPQLSSQLSHIDTNRHGLDVLNDIEKRVFDRRTDVNRDLKKVQANIEELKNTLPPEEDRASPVESLDDLRSKKAALDKKREEYLTNFERERRESREATIKQYNDALEVEEQQRQQKIAEINRAFEAKREELTRIKDDSLQRIEEHFHVVSTEKQQAYESRMEPITAEMARLEEASRNAAALKTQRDMLKKFEAEELDLKVEAGALTTAIDRVREYRLNAVSEFPIDGLSIVDGEVHYEGLAFDQLNTAKRIELAVNLAVLKSGDLGVICVDGCEALDNATFAMLETICREKGLQMICTEVTNEDFEISTRELEEVES
jgi:DNA repair exonuclease SbcCD ATPase subunit